MRKLCVLAVLALLCFAFTFAQTATPAAGQAALPAATATAATSEVSPLPAPARTGGMSLHEALAKRRSIRSYTAAPLSAQEVSQLLRAAQGVTDDNGHRTAPSGRAQYFLRTYLATADGFFEYIPAKHGLAKMSGEDLRAKLSTQATVTSAPFVLLIAGDDNRAKSSGDNAIRYVYLEAGHAAQNVLLEATALGLGAVPVGGFQPPQAAQAAGLPSGIVPIYLIPVGRPK